MEWDDLIVVDPSRGRRVYGTLKLPSLAGTTAKARLPAAIVERIRANWGLTVALLCCPEDGSIEVELLLSNESELPEWKWVDWDPEPPIPKRLQWAKPGWLIRTVKEIDSELARIGRRRISWPRQVRHTDLTALLRVETDRGCVWYKALPPVFKHEGAVVSQLGHLQRNTVPTVVSAGTTWWLSEEFLPEQRNPHHDAFAQLADLQVATINSTSKLTDAGCPRRDLSGLANEIEILAGRTDLIDVTQCRALNIHAKYLKQLCDEISSYGFPECVVHGDFHADNRRWTVNGWLLYDWTDSAISHPFLDLAVTDRFATPEQLQRHRTAYARRWLQEFPERVVTRMVSLSETIGSAYQAINYLKIADGLPGNPPKWLINDVARWTGRLDRAIRTIDV